MRAAYAYDARVPGTLCPISKKKHDALFREDRHTGKGQHTCLTR